MHTTGQITSGENCTVVATVIESPRTRHRLLGTMFDVTALVRLIPKPLQVPLLVFVLGGAGVFAHETRYMTVADFTKSYILDLKREIRENRNDLANVTEPAARALIIENIERLLDELCLEVPADPYCEAR